MTGSTFGKTGMVKPVFLPIIRVVTVRTLSRIVIGPVMTIRALGVAGVIKENFVPGSGRMTPGALWPVMRQVRLLIVTIHTTIGINVVKVNRKPGAGGVAGTTREPGKMIFEVGVALITIGQTDMIKLGLIPACHRMAILAWPFIMIEGLIILVTSLATG